MIYDCFLNLYFILDISNVNENLLSLEKLQKNSDKILLLYIVNQE